MGKETEAQRSSTDLPKAKHNRVRPTTLILWIPVYPFSVKLEKSFIAVDVLLVKNTLLQWTISIIGLLFPLYCVCSERYLGDNGIVMKSGAGDVS